MLASFRESRWALLQYVYLIAMIILVLKKQGGLNNNKWIVQVLSARGLQMVQWELPLHLYTYMLL